MSTQADSSRIRATAGALRLILCLLTISLAGCATRRVVMVNDRGEELTCETRGYGIIASLAAVSEHDECVKDAEKRGYRLKKEHGE